MGLSRAGEELGQIHYFLNQITRSLEFNQHRARFRGLLRSFVVGRNWVESVREGKFGCGDVLSYINCEKNEGQSRLGPRTRGTSPWRGDCKAYHSRCVGVTCELNKLHQVRQLTVKFETNNFS